MTIEVLVDDDDEEVIEMLSKPQIAYLLSDAFAEFESRRTGGSVSHQSAEAYVRKRYASALEEGWLKLGAKTEEVFMRCATAIALKSGALRSAKVEKKVA